MIVFRLDSGIPLGRVTRTPQGGLAVEGGLARTGILEYQGEDGSIIREYVPPEELFDPESIATLNNAPVTNEHPPGLIDPNTYQQYSCGNIEAGSVKPEDDKIVGKYIIQDASLISSVVSEEKLETSTGYTCKIEETPGVSPEGQKYDRIQRKRKYNHVAIVPRGRAGETVSLRLDSSNNVLTPSRVTKERNMLTIRIDGVDYPLSTPAEIQAAINAHLRYQKRMDEEVADLEKKVEDADDNASKIEELKGQIAALEAQIKDLEDPVKMDSRVNARVDLVSKASRILGNKVRFDGLSTRQIMEKTIAKAMPSIKLDGKSDDFVTGIFETIQARKDSDPDDLSSLNISTSPIRRDEADPDEADPDDPEKRDPEENKMDALDRAKHRMHKANRERAMKPLAYSK